MAHPYLFRLDERISKGLSRLSDVQRAKHRQFILSQQNDDGGFGGRGLPGSATSTSVEGRESDLYYTAFGIRALTALRSFTAEDAQKVSRYLDQSRNHQATVIDVVSWLYGALMVQAAGNIDLLADADPQWPMFLQECLEGFRAEDGGYAKTRLGAAGSTYHSFLVALCYELIGRSLPDSAKLVQFVRDRQRDDGGFVEIAAMKRSGTNPTAAAIGVLILHSSISDSMKQDVLGYFTDVWSSEGGFQANTRVPFADTLSTFTGFLTCLDLVAANSIDQQQLEQFVLSLEMPQGGFRAANWDQSTDVEYTFYALGTLGLLWSET